MNSTIKNHLENLYEISAIFREHLNNPEVKANELYTNKTISYMETLAYTIALLNNSEAYK